VSVAVAVAVGSGVDVAVGSGVAVAVGSGVDVGSDDWDEQPATAPQRSASTDRRYIRSPVLLSE
jgi:hypothetical protein